VLLTMADKLQEIREGRTHRNPAHSGLICFLQDLGNHKKLQVNKEFQQQICFKMQNVILARYKEMCILTVAWESGLCR